MYCNRSDNQNNEGQGDGRSGGRSNGGRGRYEEGGRGVGSGVKVRGQQAGALFGGLELNVQLNYNKGLYSNSSVFQAGFFSYLAP